MTTGRRKTYRASTSAIVARDITKVYAGGFVNRQRTEAVRGLTLCIPKAEVFGLLGPNGAGKTTTVKMICGLIRPTSGEIHLDGHRLTPHSRWPCRLLGALLEGSRNVYWNLTCEQNLLYFARLRGVRRKESRSRAAELLEEFDLTMKQKEVAGTLSRGMQQKLALCCALISDPRILLVDEPTLGLDVSSSRAIRTKLRELSKTRGCSVLLTTHDMALAADSCDRIGIISHGHIIRVGNVADVLGSFGATTRVLEFRGSLDPHAQRVLLEYEHLTLESTEERWILRLVQDPEYETLDTLCDILTLLRDTGVALESIREEKPSLEDVFVQIIEGAAHAHDR